MEQEVLEKYKKAGLICAELRQEVLKRIKPGMPILELATFIDKSIKQKGGKPAFPVNISINEIAAHYTPSHNDTREIQPGELVKIDIGVHVDGYIGDMAFTYCSEKHPLIEGAEKVLESAIKVIRPGVTIGEIGGTIEKTAKGLKLGLITNLTGHTLGRYNFHGQPSILNIANDSRYSFEEDRVIALEPFLTPSNGTVKESGTCEIYKYSMDRPVRLTEAREILRMARDDWHGLPFAKRWLFEHFSPIKISLALRQLEAVGALESYPVLKETEGKPIAQAEHTIIVGSPSIVTTRLEEFKK
ncbi:MAG: type II methionyl aminopeptidase [Candidatus Aenigmatarchaeota archaeon]